MNQTRCGSQYYEPGTKRPQTPSKGMMEKGVAHNQIPRIKPRTCFVDNFPSSGRAIVLQHYSLCYWRRNSKTTRNENVVSSCFSSVVLSSFFPLPTTRSHDSCMPIGFEWMLCQPVAVVGDGRVGHTGSDAAIGSNESEYVAAEFAEKRSLVERVDNENRRLRPPPCQKKRSTSANTTLIEANE